RLSGQGTSSSETATRSPSADVGAGERRMSEPPFGGGRGDSHETNRGVGRCRRPGRVRRLVPGSGTREETEGRKPQPAAGRRREGDHRRGAEGETGGKHARPRPRPKQTPGRGPR